MFKTEFHLTDLLPLDVGYVQLKDHVLKELRDAYTPNIRQRFMDAAKRSGLEPKLHRQTIQKYKDGSSPYPLWFLCEVLDVLSRPIEGIEDGVEWYRILNGREIYPDSDGVRKLPVKHDVYLDYLAGIVDSAAKNGKLYFEKPEGEMSYRIAKKVFGDFKISEVHTGHGRAFTQLKFPNIICKMNDILCGLKSAVSRE